jgi:hypothetical protein
VAESLKGVAVYVALAQRRTGRSAKATAPQAAAYRLANFTSE